jgi:hypothetical protein
LQLIIFLTGTTAGLRRPEPYHINSRKAAGSELHERGGGKRRDSKKFRGDHNYYTRIIK